ncbi:hypothetical protein B0H14DRAFT_3156403, partial [Mycena olivaceomarginata]
MRQHQVIPGGAAATGARPATGGHGRGDGSGVSAAAGGGAAFSSAAPGGAGAPHRGGALSSAAAASAAPAGGVPRTIRAGAYRGGGRPTGAGYPGDSAGYHTHRHHPHHLHAPTQPPSQCRRIRSGTRLRRCRWRCTPTRRRCRSVADRIRYAAGGRGPLGLDMDLEVDM